ncbi:stonustoxin subunit beta-like [Sardina pilchardus]|uniref:stonustoxin subunit beta-like n=1 Tax=Sardina pilchardus TaxID=27697 RepID=UPI002E0FD1E6
MTLEILELSGSLISKEGCKCLASALTSNPSHLKELDLSYNHLGESGLKLLFAKLGDPVCKLETLNTDNCAEIRLRPGVQKYPCELTLDPNTAHRNLSFSGGNRKVTSVSEEQPYPEHPDRFERWYQVLCKEGLSGRCYWEAKWSHGSTHIVVAYKNIERKGCGEDSRFGYNDKSWTLYCSPEGYSAWHNKELTAIPALSSSSSRVGVYLDWMAGILSFYSISSGTLTHLHTFYTTFTEPLYPGFWVWEHNSPVSLCQIT